MIGCDLTSIVTFVGKGAATSNLLERLPTGKNSCLVRAFGMHMQLVGL